MYTFGYLREATQAHIDLEEHETQAMRLQERYHIFANEAMQAICSIKPKYNYFKCEVVEKYEPIINLGNDVFRKATEEELTYYYRNTPATTGDVEPNFADTFDTIKWYEGQNIFLINTQVRMPADFIAFADKQAWAFINLQSFDSELFIKGYTPRKQPGRVKATREHFEYWDGNSLTFKQVGTYWVPYKAIWYQFISGIRDDENIDIPIDIFLTIPLYIASQCLQIDHAQRANAKRAEFEAALARCTTTDFLTVR